MKVNQDDVLFFIWTLIESLMSDYIDVIVAIVILVVAVLLPIFPPMFPYIITKFFPLKRRGKLVAYVFLLVGFLLSSYFYFKTLPTDYVKQLCWRESKTWSSCAISDVEGKKITGLHYNVVLLSRMDNYFMNNHLNAIRVSNQLQGEKKVIGWVIEIFVFLIDIPAVVLRYLLWWLWSFLIQFYLYLCPYLIGLFIYIIAFSKNLLISY